MKNELIKEFVGIDVSKLTLDVHLHVKNLHCVFSNDSKGHLSMFSSYRGKNRISNLGNRDLKSLLTMAVISSITHNPELKIYYQRRISEGKSKMSTINVVRNKLVSRIFACANRNSKYVEIYKFAA